MKLTAAKIRKLPAIRKKYWCSELGRFGVDVHASGTKAYVI